MASDQLTMLRTYTTRQTHRGNTMHVYPTPPPLHFLDTLATPTLAITCVVVVVMAFIIREMTR